MSEANNSNTQTPSNPSKHSNHLIDDIKGKIKGVFNFKCTQLIAYLILTCLITVGYIVFKVVKTRKAPKISGLCCIVVWIILSTGVVSFMCGASTTIGWLTAIILLVVNTCGLYYALTK